MATIAEQLTSLANTKTAIKNAIVAKGVTVADDTPFSAYATKISEISGGSAPTTKFGASADTWIGNVVNGVLQKPNVRTALNFVGVTEIGDDALLFAFDNNLNITSIDLSSVQCVSASGLYYAFISCMGITGTLDLSSLQVVGSSGMQGAFSGCSGITNIDLSSLQTVGNSGMYDAFSNCTGITGTLDLSSLQTVDDGGLSSTFSACPGITSVDLSTLQSIGSYSMQYTFAYCTGLTTISFPSLTSVQTDSLDYAFESCTNITEIHFRADMQETIEALAGYDSKFGATNATIYFDL